MLKQINVNGVIVTEGEKYIHNETRVVYEVKRSMYGDLKFDNDIIHVDVTADRLSQVTKL